MEYLIYLITNYLELQLNVHCDGLHNVSLPVTMAEVWLNPIGMEKYDVTVFNGFNIPVKITPSVITPTKSLHLL